MAEKKAKECLDPLRDNVHNLSPSSSGKVPNLADSKESSDEPHNEVRMTFKNG